MLHREDQLCSVSHLLIEEDRLARKRIIGYEEKSCKRGYPAFLQCGDLFDICWYLDVDEASIIENISKNISETQ